MLLIRVIVVVCLFDFGARSVVLYGLNQEVDSKLEAISETSKTQTSIQSLSRPGLQNVFQIDGQIYSGSGPEGKRGFETLKEMGVKTVISVDGLKPNLKLAKEMGLKYVHIPIGYDGITREAGLTFARVARDLKGPIYIHCHHGRHRGPVAAAVVGLCRGSFDKKRALLFLEQAGTSKDYAGLWKDLDQFKVPAQNDELPKLVESAELDSVVTAMAQINRRFEQLEKLTKRKPSHKKEMQQSLVLLKEGFHEMARANPDDYDITFKKWLSESEKQVNSLETTIKERDQKQIAAGLKKLKLQCKRCHREYRD